MGASAGVMDRVKIEGEIMTKSQRRAFKRFQAIPCSEQADGSEDNELSENVCVDGKPYATTDIFFDTNRDAIEYGESSTRSESRSALGAPCAVDEDQAATVRIA